MLRALGTQSRMQIIEVLKQGPLDVGDLAERLGISQSAVSQHLKVLKELELVFDRRHSYFISYSLSPDALARLEEMFFAVCSMSFEHAVRRREFERRLEKERLVRLREHLIVQLGQIDEAIAVLENEDSEKS
ncbi:winged helix-turn-helix transcriptional regulator [candidate division WOR-3 bacterium]|nr:winged helix-turn-helix transcriptional regulator [candidate division WOR-3 bacterium]